MEHLSKLLLQTLMTNFIFRERQVILSQSITIKYDKGGLIMKKVISLFLLTAMIFSCFSGCTTEKIDVGTITPEELDPAVIGYYSTLKLPIDTEGTTIKAFLKEKQLIHQQMKLQRLKNCQEEQVLMFRLKLRRLRYMLKKQIFIWQQEKIYLILSVK